MQWIVVGLGNPGGEYEGTRHNTGRMAVEYFAKSQNIKEWREDAKANALVAKATGATLLLPNTFMNKSGSAVSKYVKSQKAAEHAVVIYDDLDMPLGKMKISFNRSSGGHNGIKSIERAVKTQKFYRIRVGISGATPSGKLKKPQGEKDVIDFIMKKFKPNEQDVLKKVFKRANEALNVMIADGPQVAMNQFN